MLKKIVATLLIMIAVVAIWYTYPKKINKTFQGIYFQLGNENSSFEEKIIVEFNGKYKKRFFAGNTFTGTMKIGDITFPLEEGSFHEEFVLTFGQIWGGAIIEHVGFPGLGQHPSFTYGILHANNDLSEISIEVYNEGEPIPNGEPKTRWSGADGFMISAPAKNRQEAVAIANRLLEGYLIDELK